LRFKDNNGDEFPKWNVKFGNDIFQNISDKNHNSDLPILAITQEYGAVPRDLIDYKISVTDKSIESYKVVQKGDFIISLRSFQGGIEYSEYKGICSPAYIILRPSVPIDNIFYKYYLKTPKYITHLNRKLEGIRDGKMISYKYFSDITLPLPSIAEQNKISSFLSLIEARIQTQKKIIEQVKSQMFVIEELLLTRKLRLKDPSNNSFKDWKLEKLSDIGKTYSGISGKSKEDFGVGKKYIQYKQIFDSSKIKLTDCALVNISENENQNDVKFGDVFFTVSSETPGEIGMSSVLLEEVDNVFLNSFCFGFRTHSFEKLTPEFSQFFFRSKVFRNEIVKLAQGSTRYNISKNEFLKLDIVIPSKDEQLKISACLSAIDKKINLEKDLLMQYENQKKYLLSNLFI